MRAKGTVFQKMALQFLIVLFASSSVAAASNAKILEHEGYQTEVFDTGGEGTTLLLVPGFSIPGDIVWKKQLKELSRDFRVITFNHIGRGKSRSPDFGYALEDYKNHLQSLVQRLNLKKDSYFLIGVSMGGLISAETTPTLEARKTILVCPMGLTETSGVTHKILQWPVIGEIAMNFLAKYYFVDKTLEDIPTDDPLIIKTMKDQMNEEIYFSSLLATLRNFPFEGHLSSFEALADARISLIWGTNDEVLPVHGAEKFKAINPNVDLRYVEDGDHDMVFNSSETVNRMLRDIIANEMNQIASKAKPSQ